MRIIAAFSFVLLVVIAAASTARADDYGSNRDIRAIRGAIPILLASRVRAYNLNPNVLQVDDVVVNGDEAVARWSADGQAGLVGLTRIYGTWWLTGEINQAAPTGTSGSEYWQSGPAGGLPICADVPPFGAATDNLITALHVTEQTAAIAAAHIELVPDTTAREQAYLLAQHGMIKSDALDEPCAPLVFVNGRFQAARRDGRRVVVTSENANYLAILLSAKGDSVDVTRFTGRAPTAAEFPPSPGANAVYFFSFEIGGAISATVNNGSLDVWCPFVLDPEQRYSLTIDYATPALGPIYGTLFDNTLHFDLPTFTVPPNTSAMGEIDFLPARSY